MSRFLVNNFARIARTLNGIRLETFDNTCQCCKLLHNQHDLAIVPWVILFKPSQVCCKNATYGIHLGHSAPKESERVKLGSTKVGLQTISSVAFQRGNLLGQVFDQDLSHICSTDYKNSLGHDDCFCCPGCNL